MYYQTQIIHLDTQDSHLHFYCCSYWVPHTCFIESSMSFTNPFYTWPICMCLIFPQKLQYYIRPQLLNIIKTVFISLTIVFSTSRMICLYSKTLYLLNVNMNKSMGCPLLLYKLILTIWKAEIKTLLYFWTTKNTFY